MNIKNDVKSTLKYQIKAMELMLNTVPHNLEKTVQIIFKSKGKLFITGIGKSGVIAQKISSTFSSTGTPAFYMHPTEALHGNLGVVNKNDIIIAIGKSGESEELLNILPSLKKIGAFIIAMTSHVKSTLGREADMILDLPDLREACPLNLAPTTSSLLYLALGDAIAISLMKLRNFKPETFALYHPGGSLGRKLLLKVSDIMRSGNRNPVVKITDSIQTMLEEISKKWTGATSVVDKSGKLIGLVTDYDIRKAIMTRKNLVDLDISFLMNSKPTYIEETEMAIRAVEKMELRTKPLTVLPVVNKRRQSVGIIHVHDLITKGLMQAQ